MRYLPILLLATAAITWFCVTPTLPPVSGHHWKRDIFGATLYSNETSEESASFVVGFSFVGSAQVCPFELDLGGCHYFESNKEALTWLATAFKEKR